MKPHPTRTTRAARGFTLIEILVALAIGTFMLLGLTMLFSRNSNNQAELERGTRQLESARYSIDMLTEDVMHAGYFGEFNPEGLVAITGVYSLPVDWQTPDPCAVLPANLGWATHAPSLAVDAPIRMPVSIEGIAAATAVGCLNNRRPGTEAVVVRRAETGAATTLAAATPNNLYVQVSRCDSVIEPSIRAAVGASPAFNLRLPDCATVNNSVRRLSQRTYFIATCNDCAANDGIPTLKRVEMIDGALRTMSVAEGVENLQVEYGLDTDPASAGTPDAYVTTGGVTGVGPNTWQNVVSVRLHLLTRSTQPTAGYTETRTYQLGPNVSVAAPADGNKRTLLTTTVRLQNVGGRRE